MNQTVSSVTAAVGKQMENLYKQSSFDQYEFTGILNKFNELSELFSFCLRYGSSNK